MKWPTPHAVAAALVRDMDEHDIDLMLAGQSTPKNVRALPDDLPTPEPLTEKPE